MEAKEACIIITGGIFVKIPVHSLSDFGNASTGNIAIAFVA